MPKKFNNSRFLKNAHSITKFVLLYTLKMNKKIIFLFLYVAFDLNETND